MRFRTGWHRLAAGLAMATLASGYVFALHGNDPAWMMATFWLTMGTVVTAAIAFTSP